MLDSGPWRLAEWLSDCQLPENAWQHLKRSCFCVMISSTEWPKKTAATVFYGLHLHNVWTNCTILAYCKAVLFWTHLAVNSTAPTDQIYNTKWRPSDKDNNCAFLLPYFSPNKHSDKIDCTNITLFIQKCLWCVRRSAAKRIRDDVTIHWCRTPARLSATPRCIPTLHQAKFAAVQADRRRPLPVFQYTAAVDFIGRPFVKRFILCYRTVVCPVCSVGVL